MGEASELLVGEIKKMEDENYDDAFIDGGAAFHGGIARRMF